MCNCLKLNQPSVNVIEPVNEDCEYTLEQVLDWKNKLFCIRDNDSIIQSGILSTTFNIYLGIVLSCINSNSACYFKDYLPDIENYINNLITLDLCQTT